MLLAQHGQFEPARDLLIRSVTISPQAATWRNLAAVHERLGETQLAAQARAHADGLPKPSVSPRVPAVDWVDPQTFSGISGVSEAQLPPLALAQNPSIAAPPKSVAKPSASTSKKPATTWLPWNPRR